MTAIPGVRVTGTVVPTDNTDKYAVTDPIYGIDGWRGVADAAERNAITTERRREGMIAYQKDTDQLWQLNAGPWIGTDADWTLRSFGGAPGGANQEVQYNDSGAFGADSRFTFDKTTGLVHVSGLTFDGGAGLSFDTLQNTSIIANTDDLNPNGNNYLVLNCGAASNLTGIDPTTYVGAVVPVFVTNVGAFTLTLKNQSVSSAPGNRFELGGADLPLAPNTGCILLYDPLSSEWRLVGRSSAASPGGPANSVQTNDGAGGFTGSANLTSIGDELRAAFVRLTSALTFNSQSTQNLAGNTNDLPAPTVNGLRLNVTADCNLTGINPVTLTNSMTLLLIVNVGSNTVTLKSQDAGSLASNRFLFDSDLVLAPNCGCVLLYDLTTLRWRLVATSNLPGTELRRVANVTTGTTTLDKNHCHVNLDASGGNIILNIPTATSVASGSLQKVYHLKRVDTSSNSVTVNRSGGDTFVIFPPGSTSFTMGPNGDAIKLVGDAANSRWTGE